MTIVERVIALTVRTFTFGTWGREVFLARDPMARQMPQGMRRDGNALVGFIGSYQLIIDRNIVSEMTSD